MKQPKKIGVVYLIRFDNELASFLNFVESYKKFSAGVEHDLLVVFKGFSNTATAVDSYGKLLSAVEYKSYCVTDDGFDITAYFKAANEFTYDSYCFLNSHSKIKANNWLKKLNLALLQRNVGLVGATGSYQSMSSDKSPWTQFSRRPRKKRPLWKATIIAIIYFCRISASYLRLLFSNEKLFEYIRSFERFPNYHIRTNAFMLSRETLLKIKYGEFLTKLDAYKFESGRNSLTKQILNMGLEVLVVGEDGQTYKKETWCESDTFWQGNQSNLLIADNQTRAYADADENIKEMYRSYAWGNLKSQKSN